MAEVGGQVAVCRADANGVVGAWLAPVSLSVVKPIFDRKELSEDEKRLKKTLLVRDPAVVTEPEHENMLDIEATTEALGQALSEGMPLELLQKLWELLFGVGEKVFRRGLPGEPLVLITPMWLSWRLAPRADKPTPRVQPPKYEWLAQEIAVFEHEGIVCRNSKAIFRVSPSGYHKRGHSE